MKFFSTLFLALGSISLVNAQSPSARAVIRNIQSLTKSSADLRNVCQSLDGFTIGVNGPKIATGFTVTIIPGIVKLTKVVVEKPTPFDLVDTDIIVDVLLEFVRVHKQLLAALIGKHGLLASFGFATPIRLALVSLENSIDAFAEGLIRLLPSRIGAVRTAQMELDGACGQTIAVYSRSGRAMYELEEEDDYFVQVEAYYQFYLKAAEYCPEIA